MKKIYLLLPLLLFSFLTKAQISIDQNDMPNTGDTIRVSFGQITGAVDPLPTGANHTWDFSQLQWTAQNIDTFLSVSQTAATYQFVFADVAFNPNRANLATRGSFFFPPVAGLQVEDVFDFYYKSSTQFRRVGYGANINGFDTPLPMNSQDIIYNFPLNFNDNDSCDADFSVTVPGILFYGYTQHRVNLADGWGSLTTPYGTFDVLRIKSMLTAHDSLNFDTAGIGFGIDRPLTTEYKWIGKTKSIPLLQINTVTVFGTETVTSIVYRDSARSVITEINENTINSFSIYPNPFSAELSITLQKKQQATISIKNVLGQTVFSKQLQTLNFKLQTTLDLSFLEKGIYLMEVVTDGERMVKKVVKE
jgi:hypothetical protein